MQEPSNVHWIYDVGHIQDSVTYQLRSTRSSPRSTSTASPPIGHIGQTDLHVADAQATHEPGDHQRHLEPGEAIPGRSARAPEGRSSTQQGLPVRSTARTAGTWPTTLLMVQRGFNQADWDVD